MAERGSIYVDRSIASATGASQTLLSADTARRACVIVNIASTSWWINPTGGTASANGAGCFELRPGDAWTPRAAPTNAVTGIGTAAAKLTAWEG